MVTSVSSSTSNSSNIATSLNRSSRGTAKRLAGIRSTSELELILEETISSLIQQKGTTNNNNSSSSHGTSKKDPLSTDNQKRIETDHHQNVPESKKSVPLTNAAAATKMTRLPRVVPMTLPEARSIMLAFNQDRQKRRQSAAENDKENIILNSNTLKIDSVNRSSSASPPFNTGGDSFIPISVLRAASLYLSSQSKNDSEGSKMSDLDKAIQKSTLAFVRNNGAGNTGEPSEEQRRQFQKRLERLRLKQEEHKYTKLTKNVLDQKALAQQQDEITTKSMTYAASIGLNMIIAPLSFGCFMYYFGGNLMDWLFPRSEAQQNAMRHHADIRRVIVSVISGVVMLFIEMILFVIRTHEVDRAMRSKKKKKEASTGGAGTSRAFGYYNAHTERNYKDK